jgi:hypothetical protein
MGYWDVLFRFADKPGVNANPATINPEKKPMALRLAYGYVRLLLALELLLFTGSFLFHVSAFLLGRTVAYDEYGLALFRAAVFVGIPVAAFVKDGLLWVDQIKVCPKWMWKGSLMVGVYGLLTIFFPQADLSLPDRILTVTGFPLGFEAISICILYSVLRRDYLEKEELARRVLYSILSAATIVTAALLYRAGYLHNPRR